MERMTSKLPLDQSSIYAIVYTVIFGLALAIGGSVLEPFPITYLNVTAASPFVVLMITLNKLVMFRRFSVTAMYAVASTFAIFTTYLGPPSIIKPIFILAGLSFDAGTMFRTNKLRYWNLLIGHLLITITGFFFFWVNIALIVPGIASLVANGLLFAAPFHFLVAVPISYMVYRIVPPTNPPQYIKEIRAEITGIVQ